MHAAVVAQPVARVSPRRHDCSGASTGARTFKPPPPFVSAPHAFPPSGRRRIIKRVLLLNKMPSEGVRASAAASSSSPSSSSTSTSTARTTRGGGTPGSWNLGVAHSSASGSDQRSYVDRLFKVYGTLVSAAEHGDVKTLEEVMDGAYSPAPDESTAKIRDAQVRAATLKAVDAGQGKALRLLLDRGADLGLHDDEDDGELVMEEEEEEEEEEGVEVSAVGVEGGEDGDDGAEETSSGRMTRSRRRRSRRWKKLNETTTLAIDAAARGHDDVLDVLFEQCGVSTEARDPTRPGARTALMEAAANGHAPCVAVLHAAGADLDAVTHDAQLCTAAMLAAEEGHAGCLNVLRGAGANMEIERKSDGKTAMQLHREKVAQDMAKFKAMMMSSPS